MSVSHQEMSQPVPEDDNDCHEDDYVAQYFGFRPQTFMNGMYNAIQGYMLDAVTALNEATLQLFRDKVSSAQLREISAELWQKAVKKLDEKFDKAEVYLMANVFSIPKHVVLPEDVVQVTSPCSQEEMDKLDNDLKQVTDRIMAVKLANARLSNRMKEIKVLQGQFDLDLKNIDAMFTEASLQSHSFGQSANIIKTTASLVEY